ncbi:MAG: exo-alpha-sialidase [Anaerolineaceae bacterium]|nr:exo-alpha-sialidase [Anaerolineaceae bacterium]
MEHRIAFAREDTFAGWPANNGVWIWEDQEILTGCSTGKLLVQPGHNITGTVDSILLRSQDGGETWTAERPPNFVGDGDKLCLLEEALDFTSPGLALRMIGIGYHGCAEKRGGFFASLDRGVNWSGPFFFNGLQETTELRGLELSPRTDYLVKGAADCLVFLSARDPENWGSDRAFCARTQDGGLHFNFLSWITPPQDPYRGVMPSTATCGDGKLVSAVRRRSMKSGECWIDAYCSSDNGLNWTFLSRVGNTGVENGNPPALVHLKDGRLCCIYGCRTRRKMLARFSANEGTTWREELVLREDFSALDEDADFGYPRLAQRQDGKLVAMYYWATQEIPYQHIAVTIF